jgi:GGDEF domain-containing protein
MPSTTSTSTGSSSSTIRSAIRRGPAVRLVGARLIKLCADEGLVARFDGDEFVGMQAEFDKTSPESMARRLVDLLSRTYIIEGRSVNV